MVCFFACSTYLFATIPFDQLRLLQIMVYVCIVLATMFTYLFASLVFFEGKTHWNILYILLGIVVIIILVLSGSIYRERFPDDPEYYALVLNTEFGLILVLYLIPTMIGITIIAFKSANKMTETHFRVGFRIIGFGNIFILCAMTCDTFSSIVGTDPLIFSFFVCALWIFAILATVFYFLGWTMPEWFKKIVRIKTEKNGTSS